MKTALSPYFLSLFILATIAGCSKTEDPNCQSDTFWADITLNGKDYNTLTPCAEWYITIDSLTQNIDNQSISGFHFTKLSNQFSIQKGDTTAGKLRFDLYFFAPESLLQTTVLGTDTTRFITPQNICTLLDSNFHRLGNSLQDTVSVVTNILFTDNAGTTVETFYIVNNWQTSGYGFQPIEIEGVVDGECRTRFEMNALLSDSTKNDTTALYGRIRLPFK